MAKTKPTSATTKRQPRLSQKTQFKESHRRTADINSTFVELWPSMTQSDLRRLIERRPALWGSVFSIPQGRSLMPATKKNCPRCGLLRFVGPWKGDPKYTELCGSCKIASTFTPVRKKALAGEVQGAASTLGVGVKVKFDLSEDKD